MIYIYILLKAVFDFFALKQVLNRWFWMMDSMDDQLINLDQVFTNGHSGEDQGTNVYQNTNRYKKQ